jgi:imidazolonepropionase-like amidohydrolase
MDFKLLVELGMTPMQAIQSATVGAADLIGQPGKIGSLKPGAFADLIATTGDPLKDITELQRVTWVIKNGAVFKRP